MKTLSTSQLKSITLFSKSVRFIHQDDQLFVCADDIFNALFGSDKYSHIKSVESAHEASASFELKNKTFNLFTLEQINERFMSYDVPEVTFKAKPDKYENYVMFMKRGACNSLSDLMCEKLELCKFIETDLPVKNIDNLLNLEVEPEHITEQQSDERSEEINELNEKLAEISAQLSDQAQKSKELEQKLASESSEKAQRELEIEKLMSDIKELEDSQEKQSVNKLRAFMTNDKTRTVASIVATLVFLPFTILALKEYINIQATSILATVFIYLLCILIAAVWDFAIIYFSENGKNQLSIMGAVFQFIFLGAKFNFFANWVENFSSSFDGEHIQFMIVMTAICIYSPILVINFAFLAKK